MTRMRRRLLPALLLLAGCQQTNDIAAADLKPVTPGQQSLNIASFIPPSETVSIKRAVRSDFLTLDETIFDAANRITVQTLPPGSTFRRTDVDAVATPEGFLRSQAFRLPQGLPPTPVETIPVRHERFRSVGYLMKFRTERGAYCTMGHAYYGMRGPSFDPNGALHDTVISAFACHPRPAIPDGLQRAFLAAEPLSEPERAWLDRFPVRGKPSGT